MEMEGKKNGLEKVAAVGIRNQVTVPKTIRDRMKITAKTEAFIRAVNGNELLMTLEKPASGVYNRIKISQKGQLVIPKNLRHSLGIKEGTNLVFKGTASGVTVKKLSTVKRAGTTPVSWSLLIDFFTILKKKGLQPAMKDGKLAVTGAKGLECVRELEELFVMRLMAERTAEGMVLIPLS